MSTRLKLLIPDSSQFQEGVLAPVHYIILNNGILKSNALVFPQSEGFISQYTP